MLTPQPDVYLMALLVAQEEDLLVVVQNEVGSEHALWLQLTHFGMQVLHMCGVLPGTAQL